MFGKNWKTSLSGLGMVLTGAADIVHGFSTDTSTIKWQVDITAIVGGLGLLFAKDSDVTGGAVFQGDSAKAAMQKAVQTSEVIKNLSPTTQAIVAEQTPEPKP